MVDKNDESRLSGLLKALCDTTRRSLLTRLCQQGPTRVTDLAHHYAMSLNAISKHIKVLEAAGLVKRTTLGRVHLIEADLERVEELSEWFASLRSIWLLSLDKLDTTLNDGDSK